MPAPARWAYLREWCGQAGAKFDKSDGAGKLQVTIF